MRRTAPELIMIGVTLLFAVIIALKAAHAAEPVPTQSGDIAQLVIVLTYVDGKLQGGDVAGTADTLEGCENGLQQFISTIAPKPGVEVTGVCTPLPPPPKASHHEPASKL